MANLYKDWRSADLAAELTACKLTRNRIESLRFLLLGALQLAASLPEPGRAAMSDEMKDLASTLEAAIHDQINHGALHVMAKEIEGLEAELNSRTS